MSKKRNIRKDILTEAQLITKDLLKWRNIEDWTALILSIIFTCFLVYVVIKFANFK